MLIWNTWNLFSENFKVEIALIVTISKPTLKFHTCLNDDNIPTWSILTKNILNYRFSTLPIHAAWLVVAAAGIHFKICSRFNKVEHQFKKNFELVKFGVSFRKRQYKRLQKINDLPKITKTWFQLDSINIFVFYKKQLTNYIFNQLNIFLFLHNNIFIILSNKHNYSR